MRRGLIAVGTIAALVGVIAIIDPTVLARTGLSLPSVFVTIIGVLALIEALRAGYSRYSRSVDAPDLPEPEFRLVASVPGTDFDDRLATVTGRVRGSNVRNRSTIRDRLTETAIEVLVRYDGDTPDRARERLETGSWTDDRAAAAFFAPAGEFQPSTTEWIRRTMSGENTFRWRTHRAIAALANRIETEGMGDRDERREDR
jgi:hypothetical protein